MDHSLATLHWPDTFHILGYIGLVIVLASLAGRMANFFRSPRLLGYLLTGIVLGPSLAGILPQDLIQNELSLITDIALAVIAFSIGGAIRIDNLKLLGGTILRITFSQALVTFIFCSLCLGGILALLGTADGYGFFVAVILGSIAVATAPAAILAMMQEYHAKGPFTEILLGIVAIDDALALILFAFVASIIGPMAVGEPVSLASGLLMPMATILFSLVMGAFLGVLRKYLNQLFPEKDSLFGIVVGYLLLTTGITLSIGASPLLAAMTLGFVVGNFVEHHEEVFEVMTDLENPIFALFFALAGALLDFSILQTAGWLAVIYMLLRFLGKYLGTWVGARGSRAPVAARRYLGLALLPQAGVSMGLVLYAQTLLPDPQLVHVMVNIVIGSIILNELLTPFLVHYALIRSGEIEDEKSFHLRHM